MHIVITGASSGIGAALARAFDGEGRTLTLVARRQALLESLAEDLQARCVIVARDLSESPLDTGWVDEAGEVDVLVNNAGLQIIGPTDQVDPDDGERSLRLNLFTPLRLTRAVLPRMKARGTGAIVNIASMAALAPTLGMTYYNASKAGLAGASEALHGELRGSGVEVVTVYPGIIPETAMAQAGEARYERSLALRLQPRGSADELARQVVRAVDIGRPRVIYPRMNAAARYFPAATRWLMDRLTPSLSNEG